MVVDTNPYVEQIDGNLFLAGTRHKLYLLVEAYHGGWDAEALHEHFPHLSLAQIHGALAYYFDHKDDVDAIITEKRQMAEDLRPQLEDLQLRDRLIERARGLHKQQA